MSRNSRNRGKRYEEPKLNMKKVVAVILAIVVIIMSIFVIKGFFSKEKDQGKITSQSYFAAFKNNKWGVINSAGQNVVDPSYEEMIVVPDNKTDIFLCTYDVNYDTGEYKTKALNSKNEEIFTDYNQIEAISNTDENNNLWYEKNVLKVQKNGKWGLINYQGKEVLPLEYEKIEAVKGIENAFLIQKDGKFGIADNEGKIILNPQYMEITNLGTDNKSGYIIKDDSGKYGIIDYSKNVILENKYDNIDKTYGNDLYVVTVGGAKKIVNKSGEDILTQGFDDIKAILKTKDEGIIYKKGDKYGVMTLSGEVKIQPEYDDLKEAKSDTFIATKAGKVGVIDINNVEKVPYNYTSIVYNEPADIYIAEDQNYNSNVMNNNFEIKQAGILIEINEDKGYFKIRQNDEYKYYNFKFEEKQEKDILTTNTLFLSKKDGKYGFVDKDGKVVVDYQYDDAMEQNEYGFAAVKKDGKWGAVDNKGQVVVEPTFNLDDYLMVDFIGAWHLGKDLNMNYYEN